MRIYDKQSHPISQVPFQCVTIPVIPMSSRLEAPGLMTFRRLPLWHLTVSVMLSTVLAACGGGGDATSAQKSAAPASTAQTASETVSETAMPQAHAKSIEAFSTSWGYNNTQHMYITVDYDAGVIRGHLDTAELSYSGWDSDGDWVTYKGCWAVNRARMFLNGVEVETANFDVSRNGNRCTGDFTLSGQGRESPQNSPWAGHWTVIAGIGKQGAVTEGPPLDFPVQACKSAKNPPLPVYHARRTEQGAADSVYTAHPDVYQALLAQGYTGLGVEFQVESQNGWSGALSRAVPYQRYWFNPWSDSINVSSASDINILNTVGFEYRMQEGFIYSQQVPNTVPLYRAWINWGNDDVEHLTTVHGPFIDTLVQTGWHSDGIVGYVCMP